MAYLPRNIGQRIKELREQHGMSQDKLAGILGIDKGTLSRAESSKSKGVGSDILLKLAEYFNVSADFLLGLTCMPDSKNYGVDALGLSVDAAKAILSRSVHMPQM